LIDHLFVLNLSLNSSLISMVLMGADGRKLKTRRLTIFGA
jgi:hypothetical protein